MRGSIHSRQRAKQLRDFSGLPFQGSGGLATITPTDVDGLIEYHNKLFIFFETKLIGTEVPYGQWLAMTRLVNAIRKPCAFVVTHHEVSNPERDIDMASTVVESVYYKLRPDEPARWLRMKYQYTLKQICDAFIERIGD